MGKLTENFYQKSKFMNKKLIIFGNGKIADVVHYYAKEECGFEVVAFTVNEEFNDIREFNGLQVHNMSARNARVTESTIPSLSLPRARRMARVGRFPRVSVPRAPCPH